MMNRLSYREKKMFIACIVTIIIGAVFYGVIKPMFLRISTLDQEIDSKQRELGYQGKKIAQAREFERQSASFFDDLKDSLSPDQSMALFVSQIEKASKSLNLKILDLKPQKVKEEEFFNHFSLNLSTTGELIQILELLQMLQLSPNSFIVEEVSIEKKGSHNDDLLRARFVVSKIVKTNKERLEVGILEDKKNPQNKEKPFSRYVFLTKRNLFKLSANEEAPENSAVNFKEEFMKNYKISGVLLDERPTIIMQDTKEKKNLFLSCGESAGGFKIMEIYENKIILEKQHQKIEVSL